MIGIPSIRRMTSRAHYTRTLLLRVRTDDAVEARIAELAASEDSVLIFLHGPAIEGLAADRANHPILIDRPDFALAVCSAGWQRRTDREPPPPWQLMSLAQFWHALDRSTGEQAGKGRYLIDIQHDPQRNERDWQELLELVLAGAALDLDLIATLTPEAQRALRACSTARRAWQQLSDHRLATLIEVESGAQRALAAQDRETITA